MIFVTEGLPGLRRLGARMIRWRVSWIWYVLAVAVPLAVHLASISANMALGASAPSLGSLTPWYGLPLAIGIHIIDPFGGALMEEPSFRGFAQPELQKTRSRLAATAIMAVLISGWHAPLFFMPVFEAHPIGFATTVAVTFWYAWLFNHAAGSVLLTLIAHGVEGSVETNNLWGAGADLERLNWTYAFVWCPRRPGPGGRRPPVLGLSRTQRARHGDAGSRSGHLPAVTASHVTSPAESRLPGSV